MFGSFSTTRNPHSSQVDSAEREDAKLTAVEKAFTSLLANSIAESLEHALGPDVLQILESKGLVDNSSNAEKFDGQLRSIFSNGAKVLERLIVKDLYRKLGLPYNSASVLDYSKSIEVARETCRSFADQVVSD